jgi:hypothetical protein
LGHWHRDHPETSIYSSWRCLLPLFFLLFPTYFNLDAPCLLTASCLVLFYYFTAVGGLGLHGNAGSGYAFIAAACIVLLCPELRVKVELLCLFYYCCSRCWRGRKMLQFSFQRLANNDLARLSPLTQRHYCGSALRQ